MHASFAVLQAVGSDEAERAAGRLAAMLRQQPGRAASAIYLSLDGTAVVHCGWWAAGPGQPTGNPSHGLLRALAREPGIRSLRSLGGTLAASIDGPAADQVPGAAVLAIRHVRDRTAATELARLLISTGEWKRDLPGFIGAAAYVSANGRDFINYPRWVDEAAYRAYMADPRIAGGQDAIARNETAPPEFIRCGAAISIPGGHA